MNKIVGVFITFIILMIGVSSVFAQSNDDCMMCHEDNDLTKKTRQPYSIALCKP